MRFLRKYLFSNFGWKILSVIFSMSLWFYCMNITADAKITTEKSFNLSIENDELFSSNNMILQNRTELEKISVRLRIRGFRSAIDDLNFVPTALHEFSAYINLGLIELLNPKNLGVPVPTLVFLKVPDGFEIIEQSPMTVNVILERNAEARKTVVIYKDGKPAEGYGYTDLSKEAEDEVVNVHGPATLVSRVVEVRATVNVKNAKSDVTQTVTPIAVDFEGNVVEDVTITPSEIEITVPIYKLAKIPVSKPEYRGEPPTGYIVTGIDWNPKYAEVMGTEEAVSSLREITLLPVDGVEEATDDLQVPPYDLRAYLPTNIQIVNGTEQEINVTVYIEKLVEKTFTLSKDKIKFTGGSPAVIEPDLFEITMSGADSEINNFDASTLMPTCDISALPPGTHDVSISVTLPSRFTLVGEKPEVTIEVPDYGIQGIVG